MKKKGYSIYKKTIFFLVFAEVSCIFLMVTGYTTASNIMKAGNPQKYLRMYNIYSVIMIIVLGFMFTITGLSILKSVRNGGKQASYVTLKLSEGDTEIEIGEISNRSPYFARDAGSLCVLKIGFENVILYVKNIVLRWILSWLNIVWIFIPEMRFLLHKTFLEK